MRKVEVLVATMKQKNFDLIYRMNIQSDVLFANQDDEYRYDEMNFNGHKARMLTTPDKGVGKNRNKGLLYAEGDILLFSDDDMVYQNGYEREIIKAYEELPQADMIIFGCHLTKKGKIYATIRHQTKKMSFFCSMKYGTCVISIKKESWLRSNIYFSLLFGGGCPYSAGEDSLFIRECFKKNLKIYGCQYILGKCAKDSSTWFKGYTEKYFYDKGILYSVLFPKLPRVMCVQFIVRHYDLIDKNINGIIAIKAMLEGVRDWKRKNKISNLEDTK